MKTVKIVIYLTFLVSTAFIAPAQVKIGSNPTSISSTSNLEVEATNGKKVIVDQATGSLKIQNTPNAASGVSAAVIDNATGELQIMNNPPFIHLTYEIKDVLGDAILGYDTRIPVKDYIMTVVGSDYQEPLEAAAHSSVRVIPVMPQVPSPGGIFDGETWVIYADHPVVYPIGRNNTKGVYKIDVLLINRKLCKSLGTIQASMDNSLTKDAIVKPAGL